jgi:hypothetical protein
MRAYIFSLNNYEEESSSPQWIPSKQWANVQMQIEQVGGIWTNIYGLNGKLLSQSYDKRYFGQ